MTEPSPDRRLALVVPLAVLCGLSLAGAAIPRPLDGVFGAAPGDDVSAAVHWTVLIMPWLGLLAGWLLWRYGAALRERWRDSRLARWWRQGWGFDALYDSLLVRPLLCLARLNRRDVADQWVVGLAAASRAGHSLLSATQNGRLRWYAAVFAFGALLAIALVTS